MIIYEKLFSVTQNSALFWNVFPVVSLCSLLCAISEACIQLQLYLGRMANSYFCFLSMFLCTKLVNLNFTICRIWIYSMSPKISAGLWNTSPVPQPFILLNWNNSFSSLLNFFLRTLEFPPQNFHLPIDRKHFFWLGTSIIYPDQTDIVEVFGSENTKISEN